MPPLDNAGETEAEFKELSVKLGKITDETKRFAESATREIKAFGTLSEETKAKADESLTKLNETNSRLADIEQKLARRGSGSRDEPLELKTLGEHVCDNDTVKSFGSGRRGSVSVKIETKDVTSASTTVGATVAAGNSMVRADRQGGITMFADRRMTVRDLLMPGSTSSSVVEYVVETSFTNSAAPVVEGAVKPKSDVAFDLRSAPVRTLAHYFKASRQIMDDAPALRSIIDGRLRYGLDFVEEAQLLFGVGTGANLLGIVPQATAYASPIVYASPTILDQLRLAILQATLTEYPASGVVMNVADWARVDLLKDSTANYIIGRPQGVTTPTVWGLPVVATPAMTIDKFLVGAFRSAAQVFDRMAVEVLLSTENENDFITNMMTIRGEERIALCVYRPAAFIYGDLGFV